MTETTPKDTRATILAQLDDPRAAGLDIEAWVQILARSGERIASSSRTRLATSANRARVAGVPLTTVVEAWMAVGAAALATESRSAVAHLRLLTDGTRALCAGYADGQVESMWIDRRMPARARFRRIHRGIDDTDAAGHDGDHHRALIGLLQGMPDQLAA